MNIKIKGFITCKKSELYSDCADNYAFSKENNKFAISDGVSKSFFPKIWSEVLVCQYVNQNQWKDDVTFITECQKKWQSEVEYIVNQPNTKWFTKSQYNRKDPAMATFVGLHFIENNEEWFVEAQALGDSFLFFVKEGSDEIKFLLSSKTKPIVFDNFPDYLSSIGNNHKGEKSKLKRERIENGTFFLMTDALAEWFLKDTPAAIQKLTNIKTQEQYLITIENERIENRLNDDDSAVLIIEITDADKNEVVYSNVEVNSLSELIEQETDNLKKKELESSQNLLDIPQEKQEENKGASIEDNENTDKVESKDNEISESRTTKYILDKF